jgi:hypothetical protein
VDQHAVGRPGAAGGEVFDEIEVAHRDELDAPAPVRVVEARRHVPRGKAERGVLGPRERIVAQVNTAQQREIAEPLGLAADLGHERAGLARSGREQHLHSRPQPGNSVGERGAGERAGHESRAYLYSIPR